MNNSKATCYCHRNLHFHDVWIQVTRSM